eukprot:CAMPEP_0198199604 /NCGR_PEP_ID=MMETSP1445-20131203/2852_1 /TAXON_ID=36898 /ORGANISM="Pyramimonas sp., Strain CCMP2087" /LENGTH=327 /DNA_ID=CAMNT_0043869487 /DNA_START=140 /DNA_END=1120 /DNA_ORIENTATION=-
MECVTKEPEEDTPIRESCKTCVAHHDLSFSQINRYSRQILTQVGIDGQAKICASSVLVIGAGGLGSPVCLYLSAAGVGRLGIVDQDEVELSNLHRQIIHREAAVGTPKVESAAVTCRALNSSARISIHNCGLRPDNAVELVRGHTVVVDCSDNPSTRYLINDACVVHGIPLVSGSAIGMEGQLTVYHHGPTTPCYRCTFPVPQHPEDCARCADSGVLGPVPGVIGSMQAMEALKIMAGVGEVCAGKLLMFDAMCTAFHTFNLKPRDPGCAVCGDTPSITAATVASYDYKSFSGSFGLDMGDGKNTDLLPPRSRISAAELAQALMGTE